LAAVEKRAKLRRPMTRPQPPPSSLGAPLARTLGLASSVAIVIGCTIGSGIFRTPAAIADRLPSPLAMLAVWVAGGVLALCGALSLAEVSGALPRTGGIYAFLREAWGERVAFCFGWAELSVIRAAALGALSMTFAEYFSRLLGSMPQEPGHADLVHAVAAAAIALTAAVNAAGVKLGAALQGVTAAAKYAGLLVVVVAAFAAGPAVAPPIAGPSGELGASGFALALVSVLWAFDGWADLSFVAGEVRDPARTLPRALIGGTLAVLAIYLAANLGYLAVLSVDELRVSKLVAADVAERALGAGGAAFVGVTVMISTFGTLNGSLLTSPRIFYAMAADGLLFRRVAAVHPRLGTPYAAILLSAALGIAFVLLRSFEELADAFVTAILPFYALGVASVFRLRRRPGYAPPFRVPGYPVVPALFVGAAIFLLGSALWDPESRTATAAVLGVVLLGIPLFRLTPRGRERARATGIAG
jgi:amino acid transporter